MNAPVFDSLTHPSAAIDPRSHPSFMAEFWSVCLQLFLVLVVGGVTCFVIVWVIEGKSFNLIQTLRHDLAIMENKSTPPAQPLVVAPSLPAA